LCSSCNNENISTNITIHTSSLRALALVCLTISLFSETYKFNSFSREQVPWHISVHQLNLPLSSLRTQPVSSNRELADDVSSLSLAFYSLDLQCSMQINQKINQI